MKYNMLLMYLSVFPFFFEDIIGGEAGLSDFS